MAVAVPVCVRRRLPVSAVRVLAVFAGAGFGFHLQGDVVQVDGRRPKYVQEARENARLAATALSRVAGISVPVMPVLAFAGSGVITFYGMPKGCIVSGYQELGRVLNSRGERLAAKTVRKLYAYADHPGTWVSAAFDRYEWSKSE